jgi:hypothetical protein
MECTVVIQLTQDRVPIVGFYEDDNEHSDSIQITKFLTKLLSSYHVGLFHGINVCYTSIYFAYYVSVEVSRNSFTSH